MGSSKTYNKVYLLYNTKDTKEYFVLFFWECKFRRNNIKFANKTIISDFEDICKYIYDLYQKDFYEIDYLLKLSADS